MTEPHIFHKYAKGDRVQISLEPRTGTGGYVSPSFTGAIGVIQVAEMTSAGSYQVQVGRLSQFVGQSSLKPAEGDALGRAILHAERAVNARVAREAKGKASAGRRVTISVDDLALLVAAARR